MQGCGKSLAAKATASAFGLPLLRLEFGALFNKYHGETERNLRDALKMAEVMSPCVLWLDEIEKGLGGQNDDTGTARRVLASLLTWMSERDAPVMLVATANDITSLPAELIRKGRFDEIFFVDLPTEDTRAEIFEIHMRKRKRDPGAFDIKRLAACSKGYTGAEIEQVIVSAMHEAFAERSDELGIFGHGFTYSGHPVCAAVALRNLEIMEELDLFSHAAKVGALFQERLHSFADHPLVGETRGAGLIGGIELVKEKEPRTPFAAKDGVAAYCASACAEAGLIVRNIGDTVAFCPPLVITDKQVDELFSKFAEGLDKTLDWVG